MTPSLAQICSGALLKDLGKALKEERRSAVFTCGGSIPILVRDGHDATSMPRAQNEGTEDDEKTKSASVERCEGEEGMRDKEDREDKDSTRDKDEEDKEAKEDKEGKEGNEDEGNEDDEKDEDDEGDEDDDDDDEDYDDDDEDDEDDEEISDDDSDDVDDPIIASAVTLRWDGAQASSEASFPTGFKARLPFDQEGAKALEQLIRDCQPATFGQGGKDVFDEAYRKASKLDKTQFATDFNPYEVGIVDAIAQVLLPSVGASKKMRGVKAELYKLNIYSAPSGRFRAHVDTPRHESQFGSLVVCLPCAHEGGALVVRHKSNAVTFDWSHTDADAPSIRWAAFYSDCEHEVLEVTSGHRVTLTYNLYVARGTGTLTGHCMSMDPTQLPLFAMAKRMLDNPGFVPDGCTLGVFCSHAYAHTNWQSIRCLPSALKGIDMAVYEIFRALGCPVRLVPISRVDSEEYDGGGGPGSLRTVVDLIGTKLHGLRSVDYDVYEDEYNEMILKQHWYHTVGRDIRWLNEPMHDEPALMYMTYGNEPSMSVRYSSAALLIDVPSFQKRGAAASEDN